MNDWIARFRSWRDDDGSSRTFLYRLLLIGGGLLLLWGLIVLMPSSPPDPPVASDAAGTVATSAQESEGLTVFTPGRIAVLVLLVGGGVAAIYLRKQSTEYQSSTATALQSLGQLPLSPNQQLQLVRCSDEVLLLGVSSEEIKLLTSYSMEEFDTTGDALPEDERLSQHSGPTPATLSSFAHVLRQYANGSHD